MGLRFVAASSDSLSLFWSQFSPSAHRALCFFLRMSRPDLQILRSSLIITGLSGQTIAICCLRWCLQISVIEELHGKAWENCAAEGKTRNTYSWHGRRQHYFYGRSGIGP